MKFTQQNRIVQSSIMEMPTEPEPRIAESIADIDDHTTVSIHESLKTS